MSKTVIVAMSGGLLGRSAWRWSAKGFFDRPQRAVTPGQAAVFYDGDTVCWAEALSEFCPIQYNNFFRRQIAL